jgi:hypothetical protein
VPRYYFTWDIGTHRVGDDGLAWVKVKNPAYERR